MTRRSWLFIGAAAAVLCSRLLSPDYVRPKLSAFDGQGLVNDRY